MLRFGVFQNAECIPYTSILTLFPMITTPLQNVFAQKIKYREIAGGGVLIVESKPYNTCRYLRYRWETICFLKTSILDHTSRCNRQNTLLMEVTHGNCKTLD